MASFLTIIPLDNWQNMQIESKIGNLTLDEIQHLLILMPGFWHER